MTIIKRVILMESIRIILRTQNQRRSRNKMNIELIMTKETALKLFEQKQVRSLWNDEEEKWYFSIVDIIGILTESDRSK